MVSSLIALRELQFTYPQSTETLLSGVTAVVGANGSGKSTLLMLMAGELVPDGGELAFLGAEAEVVYCEQRTDEPPAQLAAMLSDWDAETFALRGRLDVPDDAFERWSELSHGERYLKMP